METQGGQAGGATNPAGDLNLELQNLFAWAGEIEDPEILSFGSVSICCKD